MRSLYLRFTPSPCLVFKQLEVQFDITLQAGINRVSQAVIRYYKSMEKMLSFLPTSMKYFLRTMVYSEPAHRRYFSGAIPKYKIRNTQWLRGGAHARGANRAMGEGPVGDTPMLPNHSPPGS